MAYGPNGQWRPSDPIARSALVCKIAVGESPEVYAPPKPQRQPPSSEGGKARASSLSTERRSEIARKAAQARWDRR